MGDLKYALLYESLEGKCSKSFKAVTSPQQKISCYEKEELMLYASSGTQVESK